MAKDILKEAIADAKAVREVALANAKAALEEAFTPKLQSMLSAKLSEELDEDLKEEEEIEESFNETTIEEVEDIEETFNFDSTPEVSMGESTMDEEIDLEEILAELELDEGGTTEPTFMEGEEEIAEGENEKELEEVKDEELEEGFDLDALLEELDGLDHGLDEAKDEELEEAKDEELEEAKDKDLEEAKDKELEETKKELEETNKALTTVRAELNEVNLLNSKLLYVNRIFKANTLNESQKLRVVESLDKAGTAKEAKLIYETIKDTFNISKGTKQITKSSIKEGLGMASKAAGKSTASKKAVISESNDMMKRFQKLANIKIN